jgi:hypothetical protein
MKRRVFLIPSLLAAGFLPVKTDAMPACRQFELFVTIGKAHEIARQVEELLGDKLDHFPFPLNPAIDSHHRGSSTTRRRFSKSVGQTTRLAGPVSSSMVMNITPLADPGFCRTRTSPAV